jgi:peptidyl-prolyl cis-trans isomerase C
MARRIGGGRWVFAASVASVLTIAGPALAQTGPAGAKTDPSPFAPGDMKKPIFDTTTPVYNVGDAQAKTARTVVAEVDGRAITLGDVADAIAGLPPAEQRMAYDDLFPRVRAQLIRQQALVVQAQRQGMDEDLALKRKIQAASDQMLADAYLRHEILSAITESDLLARYDRDYANKPGPDEVHARIIMQPTEQAAMAAITELKSGTDFAALAKRISQDTTASTGGDLGYILRKDVNADIAAVAFSLAPGQFTPFPVRSVGAWFVVKVEDRRQRAAPAFAAVRNQLTEALLRERVPAAIEHALSLVTIRTYDIAGKENVQAESSR